MHIVEQLIAERAAHLTARKWVWAVLRAPLYKLLGYRRAVAMADKVQGLSGHQTFSYVSQHIDITTQATGLEHIPTEGPLIIVCNHPTGLADGLFMHDVLKAVRPNHIYLANADALRVMPQGDDIIIPVEWVEDKRTAAKTKLTLSLMKQAIAEQKCIVIFPSGRLAQKRGGQMIERPWMSTAAAFAKKHNIPIAPAHIQAQNSGLYYFFCKLSTELRDITLFREMLNKGGITPRLTFGPVIDPASLPKKASEATQTLKSVVEDLGK